MSAQSAGWSALFQAAHNGYIEIVKMLIEAGANVLLKDKVRIYTYITIQIKV